MKVENISDKKQNKNTTTLKKNKKKNNFDEIFLTELKKYDTIVKKEVDKYVDC